MTLNKKKTPMAPNKDKRDRQISRTLSRFIPANDNKPPYYRSLVYGLMALAGVIILGLIYFSYPY